MQGDCLDLFSLVRQEGFAYADIAGSGACDRRFAFIVPFEAADAADFAGAAFNTHDVNFHAPRAKGRSSRLRNGDQ